MTADLRERRRRETRREIADAALSLFEERGYAATTVDDIADRAGISPRTFFRYFPTKEETVLGGSDDLGSALASGLTADVPQEMVLAHVEAAHLRVISALLTDDPAAVQRIMRVRRLVLTDPDLRGAAALMDFENARRITEQVASTLPADSDPVIPRLIVETSLATIRIAFDLWIDRTEAGEPADLIEIYRECVTKMHGLLASGKQTRT